MARARNVGSFPETEPPQPPTLPTARATPSSHPRSKFLAFVFFSLQALSVIPGLIGFFYSAHRFYSSAPALLSASSTWEQAGAAVGVTESRSTPLDWFLSGLWALACAYFSHSLARGLLRRWLVYYSVLPSIIRVVSLQAICWPMCLCTHLVLSFDQPVAAWMACATTAAISNVIQIWVTSNIVERKDRRGQQGWQLLNTVVSTVLGPGVRTEKFRKVERALSWKRVLWGTVVPFAVLGWVTTTLLLTQQFDARYKGGGGIQLGSPRLNHSLVQTGPGIRSLVGLDRAAEVRIIILVTSSWTERSKTNRDKFRRSSVKLIPKSSARISVAYRFLLGTSPSPQASIKMGPAIEAEAASYGDILIVPAHDSYSDLSKKVFEGWRWAGQHEVDYVFKTDDDILLRMDTLAKEFIDLGRRHEYWKGFAYWDIPAIKDASNKNADFSYELSSFPPYTAGALHILSKDLVNLVAPPQGGSRLFVMNEDQALGLWLYPSGVRPIHDRRIQQAQVCENDMIAKHFGGQYKEEGGIGPVEMYDNILNGRKLCDGGFLTKWCGVCYPSCRSRSNHWKDWGFACDELKGATLASRVKTSTTLDAPVKALPDPYIIGSADDPWVIPGLLSRHTSTFADSDDWHLLHVLCWTTGKETFQERHYQAIESIWAHEPRAVLFMMSTSLPLDFFDDYTKHGYAIHVVRIGGVELLERGWFLGPQSEAWLKEWDKWSTGRNFFSHLTDYLRYLFLFKFGGTYLDMDAPWIRSPPNSNLEFIGADYSTEVSDLDWTLDEDGMYLAPGVMRFRKGWLVFRDVMEASFSVATYRPDCFNCVGPKAITLGVKAKRRQLELNGFTILPSDVLYPRNWITSHELIKPLPAGEARAELARIAERSWSIHLFGKMTNHLRIHGGSIVGEAFDYFSLRIPRRAGLLSSADVEKGQPVLGYGLELMGPEVYNYRSRQSLLDAEIKDPDLHGSIDGRFDGLDLVFIRSAKQPKAALATVRVATRAGGRVAAGSSSARLAGRAGSGEGGLGGGEMWEVRVEGATVREVNGVLGGWVYVPPRGRKEGGGVDWVEVEVEFGEESQRRVIKVVY